MPSLSVFLDITKFADFQWRNDDVSSVSMGVSRDSYIFSICFTQGITLPSFMIVGYVSQILGNEGLPSPIREKPQKSRYWVQL